jgi:serine/threonine-protein kinase
VKVEAFYMDRTEVTNEQYLRFIGETKRARPPHWSGNQYPSGQANFPVVNVSWEDAGAYARWAGKRLPTEEEWEYAARGGEGRLYPWGNDWGDSLANTREGERGRIVAVGSFPAGASPLGLLDLVGNVWEWTSSDLRSYAGNGQVLAPGKVIRGGAYDVARERANATYRGVVQPERTYEKTGFRCVKPAQ